MDVQKADK
jgi:hypothetical protein